MAEYASHDAGGREGRDQASRRIKDARQKLTSQSVSPVSFRHELLLLYASNQLVVGLALPLFALLLGATAMLWIDWSQVMFWLAAIFVCQGLTLSLCERFEKSRDESVELARWGRRFAIAEFANGLAWASLILLGWESGDATGQVFIFAITIIMIALRVTLASQALAIVYAGTLPMAVLLVGQLVIAGDILHMSLAVIAVTAELYFVWLARRLSQTALQMIALRAQKDGLIAELEEAKAKSEEARRRAEDANLAKSRFLATMSHELRTPLNAILGFSELMKDEHLGPHANPTYREYAADIHKSGEHLLNLINEILDLSRIEAGRYELNEQRIQVTAIGRECHKLMAIRARERGIKIQESFEPELPALWADERAVRQVWLNILSNAIKFTPSGGQITLKAWRTPSGGIALSVRDTGPGIPVDEIPRILSSFGQGAIARRHTEEGAGLGLPIVKGLVELHGGKLRIETKLRQGTEMVVQFPPERVLDGRPGESEPASAADDASPLAEAG